MPIQIASSNEASVFVLSYHSLALSMLPPRGRIILAEVSETDSLCFYSPFPLSQPVEAPLPPRTVSENKTTKDIELLWLYEGGVVFYARLTLLSEVTLRQRRVSVTLLRSTPASPIPRSYNPHPCNESPVYTFHFYIFFKYYFHFFFLFKSWKLKFVYREIYIPGEIKKLELPNRFMISLWSPKESYTFDFLVEKALEKNGCRAEKIPQFEFINFFFNLDTQHQKPDFYV